MPDQAVHAASVDLWSPDLMRELRIVRAKFPGAHDRLWRDERLLRFVYWFKKRSHPPFNLIGSWTDADITNEIELWRSAELRELEEEEIVALIRPRLESSLELTLDLALSLATDPWLPANGYPVWNEATSTLIPQSLGPLAITGMTDYESRHPGEGVSYRYQSSESNTWADVYLYSKGLRGLGDGLADERLVTQFQQEWDELREVCRVAEAQVPYAGDPTFDTIEGVQGRKWPVLGVSFTAPSPAGDLRSVFMLTTFCDVFVKIRYSAPIAIAASAEGKEGFARFGSGVATFLWHFAPRRYFMPS